MTYVGTYPALAALTNVQANAFDVQAPAVVAGAAHNPQNIADAADQAIKRRKLNQSGVCTVHELAVARVREQQIVAEHGNPNVPMGAQQMQAQLQAQTQAIQQQLQAIQQQTQAQLQAQTQAIQQQTQAQLQAQTQANQVNHQKMQAQIQQIQVNQHAHTQAIQVLAQAIQALSVNQQQMQAQIQAQLQRLEAKMHNSCSTRDMQTLMVVPDVQGNIPPNFPVTFRALNTLSVARIDLLFAFYNLAVAPGPDPLQTRRHSAVKQAVGVRTE